MEHEILKIAGYLASSNPIMVYVFFFLNSTLQILFPPYPGDSIIVLGGYLSSTGILNTPLFVLSTLTATYLSSTFLYLISYKFSYRILANKLISKFFKVKRIYSLESWFRKYGSFAIILNKFLPGIGSLTLIAAGIFKLRPFSAFISIGIASILHNIFLIIAGRITGDNIVLIKHFLGEYNKIFIVSMIIVILIYLYVKFIFKKQNRNR
ncbi:membrane protein DedA with SNARE-associated domain [Fonticella tunisiensis]|uniref:Membrane protein DedA with SNARE-associated domain n=1 Tax=Fonticella tunisiensis TaxID=1096341 RepID=A0A4V6Q2Y8_9CLOT|nr:membrane protein DedA with SNARE-associated domain [Fonticella tunisiensis]